MSRRRPPGAVWLRTLALDDEQRDLALVLLRSFVRSGPYPTAKNLDWYAAKYVASVCARAVKACPHHPDVKKAKALRAAIVRQLNAAIPLCATCAEGIGGAAGGPDVAWYVARKGEKCGAHDCAAATSTKCRREPGGIRVCPRCDVVVYPEEVGCGCGAT